MDWTAEDDAAYHSTEPDMGLETLAWEDDDLLGEELEESLHSDPDPLAQTTNGLSLRWRRSQQVARRRWRTMMKILVLGQGRRGNRKRRNLRPSRDRPKTLFGKAHTSNGLLVNCASRKIQNVKGRSPSKRLASKAGNSRPGSSRRAASVPRNGVFPSSKSKSSGVSVVVVGSPIPPATDP